MHTAFGVASVLLVLFGGYAVLFGLHALTDWSWRRDLELLVLVTPVVSLGLGIGSLAHLAYQACFLEAPLWDSTLSAVLLAMMVAVVLGGMALGIVRLLLVQQLVVRRSSPASAALQHHTEGLARQLGASRPQVVLLASDRPLALTCGLWRPTILLSTWLLDHLDEQERDGVLVHELGHVLRRDYLVIWLATMLRDSFCYLPASWAAYRQLQAEKELACDDLAVGLTGRPLALASALARVWEHAVGAPAFGLAQPLTEASVSIEGRIQRLLTPTRPQVGTVHSRLTTIGIGAAALGGLLLLLATSFAVMLVVMRCPNWPFAILN